MSSEPESDLDDSSYAIFRETFLQELRKSESIAAFRHFSEHLHRLVMEGTAIYRYATPAQARAEQLQAVAADLSYLAAHLRTIGSYYDDEDTEDDWISPRDKRWTRYAARLSKRLATIVGAIETELTAGLAEADDE
jgi:hypothetical protein